MIFLTQLRNNLGKTNIRSANLQPSAPKTPQRSIKALVFQAISDFLLGSAKFVITNKAIFDRNLSAKY